jgi:hypothetical protein
MKEKNIEITIYKFLKAQDFATQLSVKCPRTH